MFNLNEKNIQIESQLTYLSLGSFDSASKGLNTIRTSTSFESGRPSSSPFLTEHHGGTSQIEKKGPISVDFNDPQVCHW